MARIIRSITPTTCLVGLALTAAAIGSSAKVEGGEAGISIAQSQQSQPNGEVFAGYREGSLRVSLSEGTVAMIGPLAASGTTTFDGKGHVNITGFVNTTSGEPAFKANIDGTYTVNRRNAPAQRSSRSRHRNLRSLQGAPFRRGHRQPWRGDQVPDHHTRSRLRRQQRPAVGDDESRPVGFRLALPKSTRQVRRCRLPRGTGGRRIARVSHSGRKFDAHRWSCCRLSQSRS